jgi:hypothetical protein
MLNRASDFDGFFGTTQETENGHEIWYLEGKESLQGRFADNSCKTISEV